MKLKIIYINDKGTPERAPNNGTVNCGFRDERLPRSSGREIDCPPPSMERDRPLPDEQEAP